MLVFVVIVAAAACLAGICLFLVLPGRVPPGTGWVVRWRYAHRGLFTRGQQVPENSLAAFSAAAEAGYGVELDVAMTSDRQLVVFHDDSLERMCGRSGKIWETSLDVLSTLRLAGTGERIPLFSEVLALLAGRVPLIVEIKSSPLRRELCRAVAGMLDGCRGPVCIESFDPLIVAWFRRHRPVMLRGQLAGRGASRRPMDRIRWFVLRNLLTNAVARPHFIAYRIEDADNLSFRLCRRLGAPGIGWTVRDDEGWAAGLRRCDTVIFETWEGMPRIPAGEAADDA